MSPDTFNELWQTSARASSSPVCAGAGEGDRDAESGRRAEREDDAPDEAARSAPCSGLLETATSVSALAPSWRGRRAPLGTFLILPPSISKRPARSVRSRYSRSLASSNWPRFGLWVLMAAATVARDAQPPSSIARSRLLWPACRTQLIHRETFSETSRVASPLPPLCLRMVSASARGSGGGVQAALPGVAARPSRRMTSSRGMSNLTSASRADGDASPSPMKNCSGPRRRTSGASCSLSAAAAAARSMSCSTLPRTWRGLGAWATPRLPRSGHFVRAGVAQGAARCCRPPSRPSSSAGFRFLGSTLIMMLPNASLSMANRRAPWPRWSGSSSWNMCLRSAWSTSFSVKPCFSPHVVMMSSSRSAPLASDFRPMACLFFG
mmetsp:Transcript_55357/g.157623  ORF Transcript_55357/g.157623 Transcript_55357/m.157623 type:complete len:380 (+) Transcript_55357:371-1510(+)